MSGRLVRVAAGRSLGSQLGGVLMAEAATPPSIVVILSDDEDVTSHRVMERTKALIADQGTVLENYFVTYSFCCPSRTTLLRGQYAAQPSHRGQRPARGRLRQVQGAGPGPVDHRHLAAGRRLPHGVSRQADERLRAGGRPAAARLGRVVRRRRPVHELRLHAQRERQARGLRPSARGPPDRRARPQGRRGDPAQPGRRADLPPAWRPTTRTARPSRRRAMPGSTPTSPCPARRPSTRRTCATSRPTSPTRRGSSRGRSRRSPVTTASACGRCARSTTWSATVVSALEETGRLDNTYVVYTSDNGFHMGQHRLFIGKTTAYEEDIRVPMAIRGPGVPKGSQLGADGPEQRSGADLRRHRRRRAAELRRRPLVPAPARQA